MLRATAALAIAAVILALSGAASQVDRRSRIRPEPKIIVIPFERIIVDEKLPWCDADGIHERCA